MENCIYENYATPVISSIAEWWHNIMYLL